MGLSNDLPSRAARLVFAMLMSLAWSGYADAAPPAAAPTTQPTAKDLIPLADPLDREMKLLESAKKSMPRDTYDVAAVVESVGRDPQRLFEWVRDKTYWVPYQGLLRGDRGVLMDRLGNSLDRSVLLYALLGEAGQKVRLAHAQLTPQQAEQLLAQIRPAPAEPLPVSVPLTPAAVSERLGAYARDVGMQREILEANLAAARLETEQTAEQVVQRVSEQTSALRAALGQPHRDRRDSRHDEQLAALRDHWWVQRQQGDAWEDLDPALPDARPGKSLAAAAETFVPDRFGDLGAQRLHSVTLRLVVEFARGGKLRTATVLTQDLAAAAMLGQTVVLRHAPSTWPKDFDPAKQPDPSAAIAQAVLAQHEWMPVLSVGDAKVSRYAFADDGTIDDATLPNFAKNVMAGRRLVQGMEEGSSKAGSGVGSILGGGRIGGVGLGRGNRPPATAPSVKTELTAEWIEYELHTPGKSPRTIRRSVFDLLGPAARKTGRPGAVELTEAQRLDRGLALLAETKILILPCQLSPQFVESLMTEEILHAKSVLPALLRDAGATPASSILEKLISIRQTPGRLLALALLRHSWGRWRHDLYFDRPNIFAYHTAARAAPGGGMMLRRSVDIVANECAARTQSNADLFAARLEQGVLDTVTETSVFPDELHVSNVSGLYARSMANHVPWVAVRSARDAALKSPQLRPDARARIEEELAAGYVVVIPAAPIPGEGGGEMGWWRVDPVTGDTLGIMESGEGQADVEYFLKILANTALTVTVLFTAMGGCGGFAKDVSESKRLSCAFCAVGAAVLTYLTFGAYFVVGGFETEAGLCAFLTGKGGFAAGTGIGIACSLVSWQM